MRTGAAAEHAGHFHEAAVFGSDDDLVAMAAPFLRDGIAAGEPSVVALGPHETALLRDALGTGAEEAVFLTGGEAYARPSSAIRAYRELLSAHTAAGASQIRVLGALPPQVMDATWAWWARYEAAVNSAYDDFPVWTLCAYDTRVVSAEVIDDVRCTHPYLATTDGRHERNAGFEDPAGFLARPAGGTDPLEDTPPSADLIDPSPSGARRAAREVARTSRCGETEVMDFVFAVNEAVTNAICHGRSPSRLRLWSAPDRLVATVTDTGPGPRSPLAGLRPTTDSEGAGLGLWLAHQTCSHVTLGNDADGFTVRLVAGEPVRPSTGD